MGERITITHWRMQNRKFGTNPAYHSVSFSAQSGSFLNSTTVNDCLCVPTPCMQQFDARFSEGKKPTVPDYGRHCMQPSPPLWRSEGLGTWTKRNNKKNNALQHAKTNGGILHRHVVRCDGRQHSPNKGSVEFLKLPTRTLSRASFRGALFFSAPWALDPRINSLNPW